MAINGDGLLLVSSAAQTVTLWNVLDTGLHASGPMDPGAYPVFSNRNWIGVWKGGVHVQRVGGTESMTFVAADSPNYSPRIAFSPDSTLVAAGPADQHVQVWRVADGSTAWQSPPLPGKAQTLAFSSGSGEILASGDQDGIVRLWATLDGTLLTSLVSSGSNISQIVFSQDGRLLVSGANNGRVIVWCTR